MEALTASNESIEIEANAQLDACSELHMRREASCKTRYLKQPLLPLWLLRNKSDDEVPLTRMHAGPLDLSQ